MTADTCKAPERVYVGTLPTRYNYGFCYLDADPPLTTEYVRVDLFDAMQARAEVSVAEAARVLLGDGDTMPQAAKMAAVKAHLARDNKTQPVVVALAWNAALRALAEGGDA